jgi:predicted nucleotidyltransferase
MVRLGAIGLDEGKLAQVCRRYGVRELSVFGSAAQGTMRPDSDVDLLVEFLPEAEPGLLDQIEAILRTEFGAACVRTKTRPSRRAE